MQCVLIASVLLLTGCLQYDLDLQFDSQTQGQWVQQVHWQGGKVAPSAELATWLQGLTERTESVGGQLRFIHDETLEIAIPFYNGRDLEARFNQFFAEADDLTPFTLPGGESIQAQLSLMQGNWLLAIYNHIRLQVDLTNVPDLTNVAFPLLQNTQLLRGNIRITSPWGARSLPSTETLAAPQWSLVAGQVNEIDADFWVPSPIGIGAAAIALISAAGYGFKYGFRR